MQPVYIVVSIIIVLVVIAVVIMLLTGAPGSFEQNMKNFMHSVGV